jgi:hypothetical protein
MSFLPKDYTAPASNGGGGKYTKFEAEVTTRLRIMSEAITGYVYWSVDNKPMRSKEYPQATPAIREDSKVKHFWAMKVFNYTTKQVEVWEITQTSIRDLIMGFIQDEDFGDPQNFDMKITKTGKGLETKYSVLPGTVKAPDPAIVSEANGTVIDLAALYDDENPFVTDIAF